jgi:hypothetical protein
VRKLRRGVGRHETEASRSRRLVHCCVTPGFSKHYVEKKHAENPHNLINYFRSCTKRAACSSLQDKANPLAQILSAAMLLRYALNEATAADRIEAAVLAALDAGYRTGDIMSAGMVSPFFYFSFFPFLFTFFPFFYRLRPCAGPEERVTWICKVESVLVSTDSHASGEVLHGLAEV